MSATTLRLTGSICVASTTDALFDLLAGVLAASAEQAVQQRGVFHVALSGGSTPEPFYMRLVTDPRYRAIPWKQTHIWVVDERRVPEHDEKSNIKMIRESLTEHVPTPRRQVHAMPVLADDPASGYERELRETIPVDGKSEILPIPRLDFVLLGMGADAHTASLFPHSPAIGERARCVAVNAGPRVTPPERVTMTFPLLNAARELAVLVTGAGKAHTLRRIDQRLRSAGPDSLELPITGIEPADGELTWFLDAEAAGGGESEK